MREVSIPVPAEHADAVRDDLLEEIETLADQIRGQAAALEDLSKALRKGLRRPELMETGFRLEADTPGARHRLRAWAKEASEDATETLEHLDEYYDPEWWGRRSKSLIAVSERVLREVED